MKKNPVLSIVISNYNTKDFIKKNLTSLFSYTTDINFEVIVVDDNSSDGSTTMLKKYFPQVRLIENKTNLGYSKSYNIGTKAAQGDYILHLNSDVFFKTKASLRVLINYLREHKDVGILGCKIEKPNGKIDLPCKRSFPTIKNVLFQSVGLTRLFPKSRLFGEYYLGYLDENKINEVDCLMGAFMLIRREVVKEIGLLDEQFFIYGEDIDFCFRAKKAGWKIVYHPGVIVEHIHGGTTSLWRLKHIVQFHKAMLQYYRKHHSSKTTSIINGIVYLGIFYRMLGVFLFDKAILIKKLLSSSKK